MAPAGLQMSTVQQQLSGKPLWRTPGSMVGQGAVRGHASPLLLPATQPTCPGVTPRRINLPFASFSLSNALHLGVKHKAYAHDMKELCGTWVKDKDASESMKAAMDMMQLGGIVRQAVKLVRGIKIEQDEKTWTMAVFSVIAWFKVTERYSLDGAPSQCKRRDLRRGKHTGQLYPDAPGPHGGLVLGLKWEAPHGGEGTDEFVLRPRGTAAAEKLGATTPTAAPPAAAAAAAPAGAAPSSSEQELHVYSNMVVDGKPCGYRTVYHRAHHK